MGLVLFLAALIVGLGYLFKASRPATFGVLAVLFCAVAVIQTTLPENHALRIATGGSIAYWAIFAAVILVVAAYVAFLRWIKARVPVPVIASAGQVFSTSELQRYARHIVLREIGGSGQQKLKKARVLVVGAGGLGSPALMYLAAAGVGTIAVVDDDEVGLSNLQRQILHSDDRLGMPKVFSAQKGLNAINPHVEILPYNRRLTTENAVDLLDRIDLVLDGSDNFATRYMVNRACTLKDIPLISAAISQWEGQISLYHPANGGPCYECVFPQAPADGLAPSCAEAGVMGALPGVVGSMMAVEAIKFITGAGQALSGEMLIYDALYGESRKFKLAKRPDCPVCGHVPAAKGSV